MNKKEEKTNKTISIGSLLELSNDIESEVASSGEKVKLPKGAWFVLGFDKMFHFIGTGIKVKPTDEFIIEGFDGNGVIATICDCLNSVLSFKDVLEKSNITEERFRHVLYLALAEIGLYKEDLFEDRDAKTSDGRRLDVV